jgi:hypothetical protein
VARLAGASGAFTDTLAPTTAGTWHAQARFQGNAAKGPAESGQCSFPVAVPSPPPAQPRPDLVIDSLKRNSFTVTNRGDGAAGPFTVSVRRGQGGTTRFDFVGLAPGSSLTRNVNCLKGDLTVTADSGETVAESDETNNRTTLLVQSCQ